MKYKQIINILDELENDYDRDITLDEIKLIREYIEQLKNQRNCVADKVDKAIEYIESYNLPKDLGSLSECPISVSELKELLKILKGEE